MSHPTKMPDDPKLQERMARREKHDSRVEHFFRRILHWLERIIATVTIVVLIAALAMEIYTCVTDVNYVADIGYYLHNVLTIVVGLEFVRMLIDLPPANTIEALIVAIARQVILTHNSPWSNLASIICIAALFATRHFLIPKEELTVELSEVE